MHIRGLVFFDMDHHKINSTDNSGHNHRLLPRIKRPVHRRHDERELQAKQKRGKLGRVMRSHVWDLNLRGLLLHTSSYTLRVYSSIDSWQAASVEHKCFERVAAGSSKAWNKAAKLSTGLTGKRWSQQRKLTMMLGTETRVGCQFALTEAQTGIGKGRPRLAPDLRPRIIVRVLSSNKQKGLPPTVALVRADRKRQIPVSTLDSDSILESLVQSWRLAARI